MKATYTDEELRAMTKSQLKILQWDEMIESGPEDPNNPLMILYRQIKHDLEEIETGKMAMTSYELMADAWQVRWRYYRSRWKYTEPESTAYYQLGHCADVCNEALIDILKYNLAPKKAEFFIEARRMNIRLTPT